MKKGSLSGGLFFIFTFIFFLKAAYSNSKVSGDGARILRFRDEWDRLPEKRIYAD